MTSSSGTILLIELPNLIQMAFKQCLLSRERPISSDSWAFSADMNILDNLEGSPNYPESEKSRWLR